MNLLYIYLPEGILVAHILDNTPTFIHAPTKELAESLRNMHWNQRVSAEYKYLDDKPVKENPWDISVGKLMNIIGTNYQASGPPKIYQAKSIEELFDNLD